MLIKELDQQPNYLMERYNQQCNAGGIYVPPYRLRQMQMSAPTTSEESQRISWELLKKAITGIVNKVNATNIEYIVVELFNENLIRGKGLLASAIIKAQMISPSYTPVFCALLAVLNTKLPEMGSLVIRRALLQFRRAYKRNDRLSCTALVNLFAHLVNQKVLGELFGLQLLLFLLEKPTEDSVDLACAFMKEAGKVIGELSPEGSNAVFNRFKEILHEGEIDKKVQYAIEHLFAVRKSGFKEYPGVHPELDLVEEENQITHTLELDEEDIQGEAELNVFVFDSELESKEEEWKAVREEILGQENVLRLKQPQQYIETDDKDPEAEGAVIMDMTDDQLSNLREAIYMRIMDSIEYQECVHKLMSMNLTDPQLEEMCNMITDCCTEERTYLDYYGLVVQRLCEIAEKFRKMFFKIFVDRYSTLYELDVDKIRKMAKLFAYVLSQDALDWHVFVAVELKEETTTSSSRIFLKILFQELAKIMGLSSLYERLNDPIMAEFFEGILPRDSLENMVFAINFFTSIGLKGLTSDLREELKRAEIEDEEYPMLDEREHNGEPGLGGNDDIEEEKQDADIKEVGPAPVGNTPKEEEVIKEVNSKLGRSPSLERRSEGHGKRRKHRSKDRKEKSKKRKRSSPSSSEESSLDSSSDSEDRSKRHKKMRKEKKDSRKDKKKHRKDKSKKTRKQSSSLSSD